jgi:acetone carboxylase alpha subunit
MGALKEALYKRTADRKNGNFTKIVQRSLDPVKWEVTYWRMLGIVNEGREIARQISASPTVKEFGECVFAMFSPTGESIAFSRGILLHMASIGSSIQWMLEHDYEEDPGFKPGDIFYNNDPTIGGAHSADQAVILPVFREGRLIAWVGGLTHCMETGGTEPGGMCPSAMSRYDDGQMVPCMRVGENDKFDRDFHIMVQRNVRDGKWWILDDRAKLAGCIKMRDSLLKLIDEIGEDYFSEVCMEMLEEGRQAAIRKTEKVLFPGRYRTPGFYDVPFADPQQRFRIPKDYMCHVPGELTVGAHGKMKIEYEGAGSPGFHSNNSSLPCTRGNHIYTLLQDVFYDGMFNNGLEDAFELIVPEDSNISAGIQYASSNWLTAITSVAASLTRNLGFAYYAMGFREEGLANKACMGALTCGGVTEAGQPWGGMNFEMACSGVGAQSNLDGPEASNAAWNPEGNLSDSEMLEHIWPLLWLGRGVALDGGGFGRKQGGSGMESLYVLEHNDPHFEAGSITSGDKVAWWGAMGGYPAGTRYKYSLINTDYKDKVDNMMSLPHNEGDDPANPDFAKLINGTLLRTPAQSASREYHKYDIIHHITGGGGGWGDPIERNPEDVVKDLKLKLTSSYTAANIYCVVWDPETMEVDIKATEEKRKEMREKRLKRGVPTAQFIEAERKKILSKEITPVPKEMYNDCFKKSQKFAKEYKEFWGLDDSFQGF